MGLFGNRGEKRNIKKPAENSQNYTGTIKISNMHKKEDKIKMSRTEEGYLCVELTESIITDPSQFYDTTRLIIRDNPKIMGNGVLVQDCLISHYDEGGTILISDGQEFSPKTNYRHILAEFDVNKLISDNEYATKLMKNLLNRQRVLKYLEEGMKENPEVPCGMYVGGMTPEGEKYFRPTVGRESHNSATMQQKREKRREDKLRKMQKEYDENYNKIAELERKNQELRDSMDDGR